MNVAEIMENRSAFSFEVFPPKTDVGMEKLCGEGGVLDQLYTLNPDYISCTYGAGGTNVGKNLEVLDKIVRTNFYKDDYNNVTRLLFYKGEDLPYEEAITEIEAIRDEGLFIDEDDNPGDASGIGETSESEQKYEFYR